MIKENGECECYDCYNKARFHFVSMGVPFSLCPIHYEVSTCVVSSEITREEYESLELERVIQRYILDV
jgi:hypothetical protein